MLATGGLLPSFPGPISKEPSPRRKGVKQGALLLLLGIILVPLLGVLSSFNAGNLFDILTPMAAIFFFLGGLLRMLYAALFEEGVPRYRPMMPTYAPPVMPPQFQATPRAGALPPPAVSTPTWRTRPNTAEIFQPPSITENTTRLLDKDDPSKQ
ncbi:MAG: hypothetical protein M3447_00910 [Acidobacteriota bacterium]|nr:hypothetical protein [Acidobacteriota bacterium]